MIKPAHFLDFVIRPVLSRLADVEPRMQGPSSERLLLGTAIAESRLTLMVQTRGPALSFFQIEPATVRWLTLDWLASRERLREAVTAFCFHGLSIEDQLAGNQHLACALARLRYWVADAPLPAADDIDALGRYWKAHYNTRAGKGRADEWARMFRAYAATAFSE